MSDAALQAAKAVFDKQLDGEMTELYRRFERWWDRAAEEDAEVLGPEDLQLDEDARKQAMRRRHFGPGAHPGTGTPQEVHGEGGLLRFGRPDRLETHNALIERFARSHADDEHESANVWHPNNEGFLRVFGEGREDKVDVTLTQEEMDEAGEKEGYASIHNHPSGGTLARNDFVLALKHDDSEMHVAARQDGRLTIYSFIFSSPIPASVKREMKEAVRHRAEWGFADLNRRAMDGEDGRTIWNEHNDRVWNTLAQDYPSHFAYYTSEVAE